MTEADMQSSCNSISITAAASASTTTGKDEKKIKKRGPFSLFKAALSGMRKPKNSTKKKSTEAKVHAPSDPDWKKIVGLMRPLHFQEIDQSPSPALLLSLSTTLDDIVHHRASSSSSDNSISRGGTTSKYASANNLQELDLLDDSHEEEDPDKAFDGVYGHDMIDAKAEEFIAQFHHQADLQEPRDKEEDLDDMIDAKADEFIAQFYHQANLQEHRDEEEDADEDEEFFNAIRGGDMIDSKAEEFIAQFYQQQKLQNMEAIDDR